MSQSNTDKNQSSLTGLTLAELTFCYQYCTFVNSCSDLQPGEKQVRTFLHHSILPTDTEYPPEWSTSEATRDQAADRFIKLTRRLQLPEKDSRPYVFFNMSNFKRLAWFFVVGFAGSQLVNYMGANAAPTAEAAQDETYASNVTMFHKGIHFDNTTQQEFHLYLADDELDDAAAFQAYLDAYTDEPELTKRGWFNCQFPPDQYIRENCCHSAHAVGAFVSATGAAAAGGYINTLLHEAFNGKRDNQKPRSVCLVRDGHNLCVSWAAYSTDKATDAEDNAITRFSVECAQKGGSSEFETTDGNGGLVYICVSNRAKGCTAHVG